MTTLKDSRRNTQHPFNYIFAKLDAEPLPLIAQADLYIDFEESPEGPRGVNLLKLICGMRAVSLAQEAVVMAQRVDQDAQRILIAINGAVEAGNAARLRELGTSAEPGILASPGPVLAGAQGLISMGKYEDALEVLKHAYAYFPKSIRVKQLEGLVLRRLERYQDAIDVLSELKAAGHQDPETMGILGAAWDGLYQQSGKMLHLRKSRELYRTAFQGDPKKLLHRHQRRSEITFPGRVARSRKVGGRGNAASQGRERRQRFLGWLHFGRGLPPATQPQLRRRAISKGHRQASGQYRRPCRDAAAGDEDL